MARQAKIEKVSVHETEDTTTVEIDYDRYDRKVRHQRTFILSAKQFSVIDEIISKKTAVSSVAYYHLHPAVKFHTEADSLSLRCGAAKLYFV